MAAEDNKPEPAASPDKVNTDATGKNTVLESGGMKVTEDRYSDIVDSSYVGSTDSDDFSSTRELRFEMFTEEFDKKFREMFSDSYDNESIKMGERKMRDIKVAPEVTPLTAEEKPGEAPPSWAPPSLVEQQEKDAHKKRKQRQKETKKQNYNYGSGKTVVWIIFLLLFLGIFALAAFKFGSIYFQQLKEKQNLAKLSETVAEAPLETTIYEEPEALVVEPAEPVVLDKYKALSEQNPDMYGWLSITGMVIDYPVMYTPEDPEYYLRRDFDGNDATAGMLFIDANCDPAEGDNQIIYGHNMHNGTMFGTLSDYADKSFWEDHQYIHFDSLYEQHLYQVVCVFRSYIRFQNEEGFRYYHFYGSSNEAEFNDYVKNIKELQLYDTGVDITYGDKLISLSTCDYYTDDGRFVVVAKLIR